ncbi:MAG TPA: gephyrin-like molybdotransferase Glp [Planctomycetota bacterium]|nr:gephyrin-like molybdotransferase Glp [Planctomycetota bacterium]
MLTVEQASELILREVPTLKILEVPLASASGFVLAEDCASDLDMPPFDKSMMDGYAVRSSDPAGPLVVLEDVPAGTLPSRDVAPGTCTKIMTGAPVPSGADAVQQVEKTAREGNRVTLLAPVRAGQNVAPRASDLRRGERVLGAGQSIRAAEIGALAAIGKTRVRVFAKPRCAVFATGDELVPPDASPGPGQIRNSNTAQLAAQVRSLGLECEDLGIVRDDEAAIRSAIREGLRRDVLLLSGGVSAGDWDLVIPALAAEGIPVVLHQVLIKPGKPFCFAPRLFGLPGNPVSAFVIFEVFVRPYLGRLMGADLSRPRIRARLESGTARSMERVQYLPASVRMECGSPVARLLPWQGAADLFTVTKANAFAVVPTQTPVEPGESIECMLL